ncbi:MAG TPA: STAS domain-containing protein [Amycolatopsis sp.]|nr:STAS domain-containing protein [Amycolatopsis sp.]
MSIATLLHVSSSESRPGTTVVHVVGEIDASTVPEMALALDSAWKSGPRAVVLDLSHVEFLGTAGLTEILRAIERADAAHATFRIVTGGRSVVRALDVLGSRLPTSPDLAHALSD